VYFKIIMTTSVTTMFHNTRPAKPRPIFLVLDWSCPKKETVSDHITEQERQYNTIQENSKLKQKSKQFTKSCITSRSNWTDCRL